MKLAPALYINISGISFPEYMISNEIYSSEAQAEYELGPAFVKWLIGTSYELEAEVTTAQMKYLEQLWIENNR